MAAPQRAVAAPQRAARLVALVALVLRSGKATPAHQGSACDLSSRRAGRLSRVFCPGRSLFSDALLEGPRLDEVDQRQILRAVGRESNLNLIGDGRPLAGFQFNKVRRVIDFAVQLNLPTGGAI